MTGKAAIIGGAPASIIIHPQHRQVREVEGASGEIDQGDADQRDLAMLCAELTHKGCRCMLSNSYTPFILDLYKNFRIVTVQAGRAINAQASGRGPVKEVLVLNYDV